MRDGFSKPSRSYKRSVCGWMLYFCATALIMYSALPCFFVIVLSLALVSFVSLVANHFVSHVLTIDSPEFPQQLLRPLV